MDELKAVWDICGHWDVGAIYTHSRTIIPFLVLYMHEDPESDIYDCCHGVMMKAASFEDIDAIKGVVV